MTAGGSRSEAAGLTVLVDRPFVGALVPFSYFQKDHRVMAIMIEINRRLYMDEETGSRASSFIAIETLVGSVIAGLAS
ncbi:MAG: N-formylglutamate amidohydrolase [bacterium]